MKQQPFDRYSYAIGYRKAERTAREDDLKRVASALERIATVLEKLLNEVTNEEN